MCVSWSNRPGQQPARLGRVTDGGLVAVTFCSIRADDSRCEVRQLCSSSRTGTAEKRGIALIDSLWFSLLTNRFVEEPTSS